MFILNVVSSECIPLTFSGETNPIFMHLKVNVHFTFSLFFLLLMDLQKFMMKVRKLNIWYCTSYVFLQFNEFYFLIFNNSTKLTFLNIKHTEF